MNLSCTPCCLPTGAEHCNTKQLCGYRQRTLITIATYAWQLQSHIHCVSDLSDAYSPCVLTCHLAQPTVLTSLLLLLPRCCCNWATASAGDAAAAAADSPQAIQHTACSAANRPLTCWSDCGAAAAASEGAGCAASCSWCTYARAAGCCCCCCRCCQLASGVAVVGSTLGVCSVQSTRQRVLSADQAGTREGAQKVQSLEVGWLACSQLPQIGSPHIAVTPVLGSKRQLDNPSTRHSSAERQHNMPIH